MMDAAQATSRSDDGECVSRTSEQWELDYYDEIDALGPVDIRRSRLLPHALLARRPSQARLSLYSEALTRLCD